MFIPLARVLVPTLVAGALLLFPSALQADDLFLTPVADTTLIERAPDSNLGGADFFNAGTGGGGWRNHGLLLYDLGALPPGAIITGAQLTVDIVREPNTDGQFSYFSLRRVLESWGEGAQVPENVNSPGLGAPAMEGEATWNHRFAGGSAWSVPGGTYSSTVSGSAPGGALGDSVLFESMPGLVADVQFWLEQPGSNFGWLLKTESEFASKTARSFASWESDFGPTLAIEFTVVPEPGVISLVGLSVVCLMVVRRRRP